MREQKRDWPTRARSVTQTAMALLLLISCPSLLFSFPLPPSTVQVCKCVPNTCTRWRLEHLCPCRGQRCKVKSERCEAKSGLERPVAAQRAAKVTPNNNNNKPPPPPTSARHSSLVLVS